MADLRVCAIDGCGKPHYGHGWCHPHWKRWKRHGDPLGGLTGIGEPYEFVERTVLPYEGDDCLPWPYARNRYGYGLFRRDGGNKIIVSRFICARAHGDPPTPQYEAAHSCGNGHLGCVNPRHLSWKTRSENQADRVTHGTSNRGEGNHFAKLDASHVRSIRALEGAMTIAQIGKMFGVNRETARAIIRRLTWTHIT